MGVQKGHSEETINKDVVSRGCGLFNFMGKKEEDKAHNDTVMIDDTPANLMEKLHSNSSSSSDEEEVEEGSNGEKKGLKEKMSGDHERNELIHMDNCPAPNSAELTTHEEDKKIGFMEKIKEKFPGHHNKSISDQEVDNIAHTTLDEQVHGGETKDQKKGLVEKIKEKLPGHGHKNNDDEEKHKSN